MRRHHFRWHIKHNMSILKARSLFYICWYCLANNFIVCTIVNYYYYVIWAGLFRWYGLLTTGNLTDTLCMTMPLDTSRDIWERSDVYTEIQKVKLYYIELSDLLQSHKLNKSCSIKAHCSIPDVMSFFFCVKNYKKLAI